jgi:hypothetical protein
MKIMAEGGVPDLRRLSSDTQSTLVKDLELATSFTSDETNGFPVFAEDDWMELLRGLPG